MKISIQKLTYFTIFAALFIVPAGFTGEEQSHDRTGDPYTLSTCPVSGKELGSMGEPIIYDHEGREVRFCCAGCTPQCEEDPAEYLLKIDEQMIKQQLEYCPLETCLISGQRLGSMGKPLDKIYSTRLVRFCCSGCLGKFETNQE